MVVSSTSRRGARTRNPAIEKRREGMALGSILWTVLVIVLIVWVLGLLFRIGGSLIHLLLIVAAAILIYNLITGRNTV